MNPMQRSPLKVTFMPLTSSPVTTIIKNESRLHTLGCSQLSGWGLTGWRLLLVAGPDVPENNGSVSYVGGSG